MASKFLAFEVGCASIDCVRDNQMWHCLNRPALLENPDGLSRQVRQALGYNEVIEYLAGKSTLSDCKALIKKRTRLFAKRQMTWFRSLSDIHWVDAEEKESNESIQKRVHKYFC